MTSWRKRHRSMLLDLDGVVSNFIDAFISAGTEMFDNKMVWNEGEYNLETVAANNYGEENGRKLVDLFFGSGGFRDIETYRGASTMTNCARELGYSIHVVTSRPVSKYPNIKADTIYWLISNDIKFDTVDFTSNKASMADKFVVDFEKVVAIEDHPCHVEALAPKCRKIWSPRYHYNIGVEYPTNVIRYNSLDEVMEDLIRDA